LLQNNKEFGIDMKKIFKVLLLCVGIFILVTGIIVNIITIVWEPTMDGDSVDEFKWNKQTGDLSQNGKDLVDGDKVHIYGRVTESTEYNPFIAHYDGYKYLAISSKVPVLLPSNKVGDLKDNDFISVTGVVDSELTVEFVNGESFVSERYYLMEICVGMCVADVIGGILLITGIVLLAKKNKIPMAYGQQSSQITRPGGGYNPYTPGSVSNPSSGYNPGPGNVTNSGYNAIPQQPGQYYQSYTNNERK
jgi:hypothetical protein